MSGEPGERWMRGWVAPMGVFAASTLVFIVTATFGGFFVAPIQIATIALAFLALGGAAPLLAIALAARQRLNKHQNVADSERRTPNAKC